ncbi:cupin domain-containing protein [Leisingera sp.]|uniref:cupin domain-containing protein n=1 Tax=Leisingera sp. TaxID=1879318 RepID=UPI002B26C545|nr:cupin domain-containing protein [Leisingera sp.]
MTRLTKPLEPTFQPSSDVAARVGSAETFVGDVQLERLTHNDQIATSAYRVTFAAGARTAWHTHPAGQILYVTSGNGFVATRTGWIRRISVGDVVEIPAGVDHWHGAGPDTPMQHIAIQPDANTRWGENVSVNDYRKMTANG